MKENDPVNDSHFPALTRLVALKTYERPDENRVEKNILNIMRKVRQESNLPGFMLFPEEGFSWAFARPRYGIAALFILFLGLHLADRPLPSPVSGSGLPSLQEQAVDLSAYLPVETNRTDAPQIPGIAPRVLFATQSPSGVRPILTSFSE